MVNGGVIFLFQRGCVYPQERIVIVQYAPVLHLRRALHLAAVKPVAGEAHDGLVHAILHLEQGDHTWLGGGNALHERHAKPCLQGGKALHRGRQLAMVPRQYHPGDTAQRYPAGGLQSLGGLINEKRVEALSVQELVGGTHQRAGYHPSLAEELGVDAQLQLRGP